MRVLLDDCVPAPLARLLAGYECVTVQASGWAGCKNGELIRRAEQAGFAVFITSDKNLRYQQNLSGRRIAILELSTNDLRRVRASARAIGDAITTAEIGAYAIVEVP